MENTTTKADRLKLFIDHLGISKYKFANTIGASKALITKLTTQHDVDFRVDVLTKILVNYPDLNITWVLTGKGEMLHNYGHKDGKLINTSFNPDKIKDFTSISGEELKDKIKRLETDRNPMNDREKNLLHDLDRMKDEKNTLKAVNKIKRKALQELNNEDVDKAAYLNTLIKFVDLVCDFYDDYLEHFEIYNENDVPIDIHIGLSSMPTPIDYKNSLVQKLESLFPLREKVNDASDALQTLINEVKKMQK